MTININNLGVNALIKLYSDIPSILKARGVIRTNNFLGDLGEYLAIEHYNSTPGLPNLQAAPSGTQNVDALSRKGDRYSIKSTRSKRTGVFYGLSDPDKKNIDSQKFEYVVIMQFNSKYQILKILELDWNIFLKHKQWHSRMRAWSLGISKNLIADAKVLFSSD